MIERKSISKNKFKYLYNGEWVTFKYLYELDICIVSKRCLSGRINNYFNRHKRYSEFNNLLEMLTTPKADKSRWGKFCFELSEEQAHFEKMMKLMKAGSLRNESLIIQSKEYIKC